MATQRVNRMSTQQDHMTKPPRTYEPQKQWRKQRRKQWRRPSHETSQTKANLQARWGIDGAHLEIVLGGNVLHHDTVVGPPEEHLSQPIQHCHHSRQAAQVHDWCLVVAHECEVPLALPYLVRRLGVVNGQKVLAEEVTDQDLAATHTHTHTHSGSTFNVHPPTPKSNQIA